MFFCIKFIDLLLKMRWLKFKDMMFKDVIILSFDYFVFSNKLIGFM